MFNYKNIPVSLKIAFAFFLLGFFLLSILFLLIIPKIQQDQYNNALEHTEKKVLLIKQQIKLVVDYFGKYGEVKKEESKKEIEAFLEKIKLKYNIDSNYTQKSLIKDLGAFSEKYNCSLKLSKNNDEIFIKKNRKIKDDFSKYINFDKNIWYQFKSYENLCPHPFKFFYTTNIKNLKFDLICSSIFKPKKEDIEARVKKIIQEGFSLTNAIHKGKVYLMWINKNPSNIDLNTPISIIDNEKNKTYCVSKISNFRIPKSGELTLKEILEVKDTEHIYHKLEGKKSLTFISKINENKRDKFIFVLSAFEEDFKNNINSPIMKILPLSIVALLISILFGVFIFKRWIKNIEVLSNTAKKVKNGNLDTRSNVKGSDEFGVLGVTFDLMLDNLQDNIKNLDRKIDERTLELRQILRSKEILLRELNHRVKNNLFMIINFIKLQKSKTEDENIIQSLNTIENRIYSISLIHTKLFESKNFDFIDMKKYLTELITDISFTFDFSIKISLSIEQLNMDIENAMYCGLIVNELLTNSFKYAFVKNKENAKINITLKKLREKYYLMYKDNGVGLKGDVNINKCNSLGIKLINSISKNQLNGKIKIKSKNGLKFSILF